MSEKGGKEEEIKKFLTEIIEPVIKDILDRINTMNKELGEISKAISRLENNYSRIDERTKIMLNIQYALIGGVLGTLIGIILMLVQLLAH